jgi:biopolymer transport protein ExbB
MNEFLHTLLAGGPMIYVILFFLLAALIIFAERFLYLHRARVDTLELLRGLINQLRSRNIKGAIANCDSRTGPVGEIFRSAIEHWGDGETGIRYAVEETLRMLLPKIERNLKLLTAISNITPLMGLLGSLFAIIALFEEMGSDGGQFIGIMPLSGHIANALVSTALGLIVSMICQLFHAVLVEKIDRQLADMAKGAAEMTYFLTTNNFADEKNGAAAKSAAPAKAEE